MNNNSYGYHEISDPKAVERASELIDILQGDDVPRELRRKIEGWFISEMSTGAKYRALGLTIPKHLAPNRYPDEYEYRRLRETADRLGIGSSSNTKEVKPSRKRRTLGGRALRAVAILIPILVVAGWLVINIWNTEGPAGPVDARVVIDTHDGEIRSCEMADGSIVWVNKNSMLSFAKEICDPRHVILEGEAMFEVAYNEDTPFVVEAGELKVTVLGTTFNVKAYPELGYTEVLLHEGSVKVEKGESVAIIEPEEKMTCIHDTGEMIIEPVNVIRDWRTGSVIAKNMTLPQLFGVIGNFYGCEIIFLADELSEGLYSINFDRNTNAQNVIEALAKSSGSFEYTTEGEKILIRGNRVGGQ